MPLARRFLSIRRVLHEPEEHEAARVGLMGFLDVRSEVNAIYATRAAHEAHDVTQGVALPRGLAPTPLDGRCVFVEGFFTRRDPARGGFSGELGDVLRLEVCADAREPDPPPPPTPAGFTDVASIVASPAPFEGDRIEVFGYAVMGFEAQALFPSEEAYHHHMFKDALWIAGPPLPFLNHMYVALGGFLDCSKQGHRNVFACELRDPTLLAVRPGTSRAPSPSSSPPDPGDGMPDLYPMPRSRT